MINGEGMNIFKVLASTPRSKFTENQMSAVLAWLLNPYMDHGLSYEFLKLFLSKVLDKNVTESGLLEKLKQSISEENINVNIKIIQEYSTNDGSIIDLVIIIEEAGIEKYYISIENKIYKKSAADDEQLEKQYQALLKEMNKGQNIIMVFLVPSEEPEGVKRMWEKLDPKEPHRKEIVTWDNICEFIKIILNKEHTCENPPLPEYLRHTLKALYGFIKGDFDGYNANNADSSGKINQAADRGRLTIDKIKNDTAIEWVGIRYGLSGLRKMVEDEGLDGKTFQCTTHTKRPHPHWLRRELFLEEIKLSK